MSDLPTKATLSAVRTFIGWYGNLRISHRRWLI